MAPATSKDTDSHTEPNDGAAPRQKRRASSISIKPKNAFAGFLLYAKDHVESVQESFPNAHFGEHARILAHQYRGLSDKEVCRWEKKAIAYYTDEIKLSKKRRKDPNAPKRNMSAYFFFAAATREEVRKKNPNATFGETASLLSKKFHSLTDEERNVWDQKAAGDKARYEREMKEYKDEKHSANIAEV